MIGLAIGIALGGALGALLRALLLARLATGEAGPWDGPARATWLSNTLGCALLGLFLAAAAGLDADVPISVDLWVITGFCGGLTTFSTAIADAARLRAEHGRRTGLGYAAASLAAGLLALELGARLGGL